MFYQCSASEQQSPAAESEFPALAGHPPHADNVQFDSAPELRLVVSYQSDRGRSCFVLHWSHRGHANASLGEKACRGHQRPHADPSEPSRTPPQTGPERETQKQTKTKERALAPGSGWCSLFRCFPVDSKLRSGGKAGSSSRATRWRPSVVVLRCFGKHPRRATGRTCIVGFRVAMWVYVRPPGP